MARLDDAVIAVDLLDRLSAQDSVVHRLDPRAKVVVTAGFLVAVMSFPRYEIAELMPLFLFPAALMAFGRVPPGLVARMVLVASPVAILVGVFNPFIDTDVMLRYGPLALSGGWLSFVSILVRFMLTVSAAVILLATTGYVSLCVGLGALGIPRMLVVQFLLLYRFIFVLLEEAARMRRAYVLRACSARGARLRVWGSLAGNLLLRAYDRGARLHAAMLARGFDGQLRTVRSLRLSWHDAVFAVCCGGLFAAVRFGHVARDLGGAVMEAIG